MKPDQYTTLKPYKTSLKDVPKVTGLQEKDGWVNMQVQFLINQKICNSDKLLVLKKPFEASLLLESVGRFVAPGRKNKRAEAGAAGVVPSPAQPRAVAVVDPEQIRAAVTVALDSALPGMIDRITQTVVATLAGRRPGV